MLRSSSRKAGKCGSGRPPQANPTDSREASKVAEKLQEWRKRQIGAAVLSEGDGEAKDFGIGVPEDPGTRKGVSLDARHATSLYGNRYAMILQTV